MKNFLKSKSGIVAMIIVAVLVIGGIIWAVLANIDNKKDGKEPERDFVTLEEGEEEATIEDGALNPVDEEDANESLAEQPGADFPNEFFGTETPGNQPTDNDPTEDPTDSPSDDPTEDPSEDPSEENPSDDPDTGLDENDNWVDGGPLY